ncbi:MAG: hypothetical protein A2161_16190 [Candidatus Schekmanbacteria bacterium RBG_13_48_7]|uniref:Flagellar FliJ protein n=1 Tax=Candidatus Schekmanbacteria bacterium RBG_13_48_7 TaxID=1817878 RepID=A0A1F7RSZ7_9BACT|nr:MAG: hypothetical protein A2161_16190 [Candidatus Schekmanbacteria bacterium RBG_13_48_7]
MKKFVFRLETLLKLEESKEKIAKASLIKANEKLEKEKKRFNLYVTRAMSDFDHNSNKPENENIRIKKDKNIQIPAHKLVDDIVNSKRSIREIHLEIEQKRRELEEIIKKHKMFKRIKEKQWQQYLFDTNKQEQKDNDEMLQSRHNLKVVNG